jgi:large subunit ribosomal protein L21e
MKGKRIRQKGKVSLSKYFKKFGKGAKVCVVKEPAVSAGFPSRIIGKSGKVSGERGRFKLVEIKEGTTTKTFIIHPIHLKELNQGKK